MRRVGAIAPYGRAPNRVVPQEWKKASVPVILRRKLFYITEKTRREENDYGQESSLPYLPERRGDAEGMVQYPRGYEGTTGSAAQPGDPEAGHRGGPGAGLLR